jgi:hypothetical protein
MTQNVRTYDEAVTGSKQIIFFIFFTFEGDTTNYRGTLVENVKKSKINPPYCAHSTAYYKTYLNGSLVQKVPQQC